MHKSAWPAVPRHFVDEAFGGWLGRVAGRYGITVDELGTAANILCRLAPVEIEALAKFGTVRAGGFAYCYRCLVLNPQDVFSPYWKDSWLDSSRPPCPDHLSWVGFVSPTVMRRNRNMPQLLRALVRKWRDNRREWWQRN